MRRAVAVLVIGSAALMIQGAVNAFLPVYATPDLRFLVAVAVGLHWRGAASGAAVAATLGFLADLLSGSLLGQQALLSMFAFAAARVASQQLNLRSALPQACFVFFLCAANALGIGLLDSFFGVGEGFGLALLRVLPLHALVNALVAPLIARGLEALVGAVDAEEGGRRPVRLPAARRSA